MNITKNNKNGILRGMSLIIILLMFVLSCSRKSDSTKSVEHLLSDTLNLRLTNIEIQIDSMNSGISRNLREILPLRDSIEVNFNEYFDKTQVILVHNNKNLYQDTLQTLGGMGWSSAVRFKRSEVQNTFDLRIAGKRYVFKESNDYNFIHIFYHSEKGLEIVYTNKGYIYD